MPRSTWTHAEVEIYNECMKKFDPTNNYSFGEIAADMNKLSKERNAKTRVFTAEHVKLRRGAEVKIAKRQAELRSGATWTTIEKALYAEMMAKVNPKSKNRAREIAEMMNSAAKARKLNIRGVTEAMIRGRFSREDSAGKVVPSSLDEPADEEEYDDEQDGEYEFYDDGEDVYQGLGRGQQGLGRSHQRMPTPLPNAAPHIQSFYEAMADSQEPDRGRDVASPFRGQGGDTFMGHGPSQESRDGRGGYPVSSNSREGDVVFKGYDPFDHLDDEK